MKIYTLKKNILPSLFYISIKSEIRRDIPRIVRSLFVIQVMAILFLSDSLCAQQIDINRINLMPDFPLPYEMRDWENVTKEYDSFVFDLEASGQYLPLLFFRNNTVNYPTELSFGLHTVVGTSSPTSGEAINVLPALIGASLVGIDKSNQNGYNWVRMSREYFNNRPEENVYLNHPSTQSGDDWWYATMPNVFFYQLYDLYPETEDYEYQLKSVADQWLTAIEKMGGSAAPWNVPNMNYRGWYLSTMTPHTFGVKEPEAAGALAWILYNAFKETGDIRYRIGAEWAMEFLDAYPSNPSYELQLIYGIYTAAKMNAELGTEYNVEKMLNWAFDVGPLRKWGSIIGNWGGLDVSGLIGEVNGSNDYAFSMNTFQQAAALLPLLRYDDRFANALGKWMLNASNASRLFYTDFLPDNKQDSDEWAHIYDPNSVLAHEAMRESKFNLSPYATGDAIAGGWGSTNLTLYSSSHVGYFGSIIDTTNVEGILLLDLLKTDFFRDEAYPTYLIYNPYEGSKTVSINVGTGSSDIYESTTNTFIATGASGNTEITIPALSSYIIVLTPGGGIQSYEYNKLSVDNVIVDYNSDQTVANYPPRIKSLAPASAKLLLLKSDSTLIYATVTDLDEDALDYIWSSESGSFIGSGPDVTWIAPSTAGKYQIQVQVNDGSSDPVIEKIDIEVVEKFNTPPAINNLYANPRKFDLGETSEISCVASDEDGDEITFSWSSSSGSIEGTNEIIQWTAPEVSGNYYIKCSASDPDGATDTDSIAVSVRDLSVPTSGNLVLYLPLNGDAFDESGNNNEVTVSGAFLTSDRNDESQKAYRFDGVNDYIKVANSELLNFSEAISLNFWINISTFYEREQYPLSHGNWENRWKISISDNILRWTINTTNGITDLDAESPLEKNKWYNITAYYSGEDLELYINGKLDAFKYWSGNINPSPVDLTIGQVLPNNNQYNFNGKLDEIRLYDYPLSLQEISDVYELATGTEDDSRNEIPETTFLHQNYPNPFNPNTNISFTLKESGLVSLKVYNLLGQEVDTVILQKMNAGSHSIRYDASSLSSGIYIYRLKTMNVIQTQKMILIK